MSHITVSYIGVTVVMYLMQHKHWDTVISSISKQKEFLPSRK